MKKERSLPASILEIVRDKGTEAPFSSSLLNKEGSYLCRQCGWALYRASAYFDSGCGWPSFDQEIKGHVTREVDGDGRRTEILCSRCLAHLGHVFLGERFTPLNARHCVNSKSMEWVADPLVLDTEEAIFAAGCFWGVEYWFNRLSDVLKVESGYTGGNLRNPTYKEVCKGTSNHVEAIRVLYNPEKLSYKKLVTHFFAIHDPTQQDGQGPDRGSQYLSVAFYYTEEQKQILKEAIEKLQSKGYPVATKIEPVSSFYPAEEYHQNYYAKQQKQPYCHIYQEKL